MGDGATAFPLQWPAGWPRTKRRARSQFTCTMAAARDALMAELARMGARYIVLSTNVALRQDGLPYANQREPDDPGVAVYFMWQGKQMTFACDRWDYVRDNVRAIQKTVEALRGIERWGASDMMQRAFSAFEALPAPEQWWQVLGVAERASRDDITRAYRDAAMKAHPDQGGTTAAMARLNAARDQGMRAIAS